MSSVIPTIVQSSMKVFTECHGLLLSETARQEQETFARTLPNMRDLFRVIHGCTNLPKESAENKKTFTRLWVHEVLRGFYDRLHCQKYMDAVFKCIRACVKTVFRENYDSSFEHLGKIDGQVRKKAIGIF